MKVLVIGGTGFIGSHVARALVEHGHHVAVLHRGNADPAGPIGIRHIRGNRDSLRSLDPTLRRFAPDVVIDFILFTEQQAQELVNTFRDAAGRVVVVSSADVYRNYDGFRAQATAPPDPGPLDEDAPLRETRHPYRGSGSAFEYADDYDKILVEQMVLNEPRLPATVLRFPAVYGPGDRAHRLQPYVQRMGDGRGAILLAEEQASWRWTRGFVGNVAAAVVLAVTHGPAVDRVYNVGEASAQTEREWVEHIGEAAGWKGNVVAVPAGDLPSHLQQPVDWQYDLWTNTRRIRQELGYSEPIPFGTAIEQTLAWERSHLAEAVRPDYAAEDVVLGFR